MYKNTPTLEVSHSPPSLSIPTLPSNSRLLAPWLCRLPTPVPPSMCMSTTVLIPLGRDGPCSPWLGTCLRSLEDFTLDLGPGWLGQGTMLARDGCRAGNGGWRTQSHDELEPLSQYLCPRPMPPLDGHHDPQSPFHCLHTRRMPIDPQLTMHAMRTRTKGEEEQGRRC